MSRDGNTRASGRYMALDIHKHYCVIAGVGRDGRVVLQSVRVDCRFAACRSGRMAEEEFAFHGSCGFGIHHECLACV